MNDEIMRFDYRGRRMFVFFVLLSAMATLIMRAVQLQYYEREFLRSEGMARHQRVVSIPAHRGMITDRNGEPLAISSPIHSVWINPKEVLRAEIPLANLAKVLDLNERELSQHLEQRSSRSFLYLKRHIAPELAQRVMKLKVPGVYLQREYHRYYPMGGVAAHVLGFTDIDDRGQEGVELVFDHWLSGESGEKRVIKDRLGCVVEDVERIKAARPGKELRLSLDRRIQYLAYRELKAAVSKEKAHSGSIVVLDPIHGEILAMANQPSFNPNNRSSLQESVVRNRAATDVFEPGSTIKPFTIAAAMENKLFDPNAIIDTSPGWYMVSGHTIQDEHDYGSIDLSRVIIKSSNVGAAKIALAIPPKVMWETFRKMGFGEVTSSGYPGESAGSLSDYRGWNKIERATLAFGYGLSVTALQLAQAYAVLANNGLRPAITILTHDSVPEFQRVLSVKTSRRIRKMLEGVVSKEGTAVRARVEGYRVAGKTGTVHKSTSGGYAKNRYISVFAGLAPATRPRLVVVVTINEPHSGEYYGGIVAAPVFSKVMAGALRLLDVPPDNLPPLQAHSDDMAGAA
jgi:cell division protein FtsI (penicillin-binding protein 3)